MSWSTFDFITSLNQFQDLFMHFTSQKVNFMKIINLFHDKAHHLYMFSLEWATKIK
jgi:hypothetical protein